MSRQFLPPLFIYSKIGKDCIVSQALYGLRKGEAKLMGESFDVTYISVTLEE